MSVSQAQADSDQLAALMQLMQVTQAAGTLVQRQENDAVQAMERLATVTETSVGSLLDVLVQVNRRLTDAERREREISALNDAQARAQDQQIAALQEQVTTLTDTVTALSRNVTDLTAQLAEQKRKFDGHYHPTTICCSHGGYNCSGTPWQTQGPKIKDEPLPPVPYPRQRGCAHQ